jgi:transposase
VGDQLDLEVELIARAGCCRGRARASLRVEDRPVLQVRDLPLAGRPTYLLWRKRHFCGEGCGRTFTETHGSCRPVSA